MSTEGDASDGSRRRSPGAAVAAGAVVNVTCSLPVFLTGALAVVIRGDLLFSASRLGVAVGLFRVSSASVSLLAGRIVDRFGATRALRWAVGIVGVASVAVASVATSWGSFVALLMLVAVGKSLAQPAANRMLVRRVPRERQGVAFGLKQSAVPSASMLAGLSVPVVANTIGWRAAFFGVGVASVLVLSGVRGGRPVRQPPPDKQDPALTPAERSVLQRHAAVFFLTIASSSVVPVFFVDSAVEAGMSVGAAGVTLAVASGAAIAARLGAGWWSDRRDQGHLRRCGVMMAAGAIGLGGLALGPVTLAPLAVVLALAGTWGLNGVFWYSLLQRFSRMPGRATGLVAPAGMTGGTLGPVAFGALADHVGYSFGWGVWTLLAMVTAAGLVVVDRHPSFYT